MWKLENLLRRPSEHNPGTNTRCAYSRDLSPFGYRLCLPIQGYRLHGCCSLVVASLTPEPRSATIRVKRRKILKKEGLTNLKASPTCQAYLFNNYVSSHRIRLCSAISVVVIPRRKASSRMSLIRWLGSLTVKHSLLRAGRAFGRPRDLFGDCSGCIIKPSTSESHRSRLSFCNSCHWQHDIQLSPQGARTQELRLNLCT